ncbi:MAG: sugar nucleotide-binding protein [Chloroflexota bacterium]|nr:sugar nucleotide-binding protein [Chloroflexota bacterium]
MTWMGATRPPLELWGGVECTVNRVGDLYIDQNELSGHARRLDDLDLFAGLGIRAIRYPVLWERTAPDGIDRADWTWVDERLGRLRELGIRPIVGLVHHGSGPRHTSLIDPAFPEGLAEFARALAERYPWVDAFTPVNEPLTTARFSGLYGHWYPHGRDDLTYLRALLTQCRAVVLSMRAIRSIAPGAQLIQTDDLGKTYSTPWLAYQAEHENHRRWLTFDLLCGRVDRQHPLWNWLRFVGIGDAELRWFAENPCPPDVIGINHYLSGERFLDERLDRYPADAHGGNGLDAYADVLALRVLEDGVDGPAGILREAWERYHRPIAVTEAHNGCTREEQLRWLVEVWEAADGLRRTGADIRAVTAWSLLGAHGWDTLVTRPDGRYESGVFDLRGPRPRPTAIVGLLRALAEGRSPDHPVLAAPGWWRRPERLFYPPLSRRDVAPGSVPREAGVGPTAMEGTAPTVASIPLRARPSAQTRPILLLGPTEILTNALERLCDLRGLPHVRLSDGDIDPTDTAALEAAMARHRPWAVIHAVGHARVDGADVSPAAFERHTTRSQPLLAEACGRVGAQFLAFSSDLVFDGAASVPYVESDPVSPVGVYGRHAADAEARVLRALPSALVVRSGPLFGPWDGENVVATALHRLAAGRSYVAPRDIIVSPTYVPDLVHAALDLLIDGERGIWHLATPGAITWFALVRQAAVLAGLDAELVVGRSARRIGPLAPRPEYRALRSERGSAPDGEWGALLPPLADALRRFVQECNQVSAATPPAGCPAPAPTAADARRMA